MKKGTVLILLLLTNNCKPPVQKFQTDNGFWLYVLDNQKTAYRCPANYTVLDVGTTVIPMVQNQEYWFDIRPRLKLQYDNFAEYELVITEQAGQDVKYKEYTCWDIHPISDPNSKYSANAFFSDSGTTGFSEKFGFFTGRDHYPVGGYLGVMKLTTASSSVTITIPPSPTYQY